MAAVTVRFAPEIKDELDEIAQRKRLPTALLVRIWVEEAIERDRSNTIPDGEASSD